jgi:hypothetical protein
LGVRSESLANKLIHLCTFENSVAIFYFVRAVIAKEPMKILIVKEGPLTKNGPIDFAQSWAIHMKKSN